MDARTVEIAQAAFEAAAGMTDDTPLMIEALMCAAITAMVAAGGDRASIKEAFGDAADRQCALMERGF